MRLGTTSDSDELCVRVEGCCIQFSLGLLLLALGLLLLVLTWRGPARRPILTIAVGVGFTGAGALVAFTGSGFIINRRHQTLTAWTSFLGFARTRHYVLEQFGALKLVEYWNRSRHGPERYFRILLCFKDDQTDALELGSQLGERRARQHMSRVSEFTRLPTLEEPLSLRHP